MHLFTCPGLPASWVNAWLAAIGVTVLDRRIRLHWTAGDAPVAVISSPEVEPLEALAESWPDEAFLGDLPLAEKWGGASDLKRRVPLERFAARVDEARGHPHAWTLSSTMTDLSIDDNGEVAHAPFDPAGPGTTKWLHHRLLKTHELAAPVCEERLRASLLGHARRVKNNGLGFDSTRLGSLSDASDRWVEPVVEVLAFFGLAAFPMRGRGVDRRFGRRGDADERQRGWRRSPGSDGRRRFVWPAWKQPLDIDGVDALLDVWNPWRKQSWTRFGVHAAWQSVAYQRRATADPTRAIGAEKL